MNAQILPIETTYRGYRFRSRLEARWAVFFDAAGIEFYYEPEAYQTSLGGYLPDFYLPKFAGGIFVEVKHHGGFGVKEWDKCQELSLLTKKQVLLAEGPPDDVFYRVIDRSAPIDREVPENSADIVSDFHERHAFCESSVLNLYFWAMFERNRYQPTGFCRIYTCERPEKYRDFEFHEDNEFQTAWDASRAYRF
jgi:hypothetical protein